MLAALTPTRSATSMTDKPRFWRVLRTSWLKLGLRAIDSSFLRCSELIVEHGDETYASFTNHNSISVSVSRFSIISPICYSSIMESHSPNPIAPTTDDAEPKMRRHLGLDGGTASSSSNDPLRIARQAIRSQTAARDYAERQLAQAQGAIQDLRTRLHQLRQEKDAAMSAAHSAMSAKDTAERSVRGAESALATERATRIRTEGMLRDAEATIRDLREKLATANRSLHGVQAELVAERQSREQADATPRLAIAVPETFVALVRDATAPAVRKPVGRPRKVATAQPIPTPIRQLDEPQSSPRYEASSNRAAVAHTGRRPIGRPRKIAVAQPVEKLIKPPRKAQMPSKTIMKTASNRTDDQEPVQWWVEGWKDG
jgi:hypothetical protein